jgi:hypothetical protein
MIFGALLRGFIFANLFLSPAFGTEPTGSAGNAERKTQTVDHVIPITMANLRGHQHLYSEGWFLVTSSGNALAYAKENGVQSAGKAFEQFSESAGQENAERGNNIQDFSKKSKQDLNRDQAAGRKRSDDIKKSAGQVSDDLSHSANINTGEAWQSFIEGNISLVKRTEEDRKELRNLPKNYFSNLKDDYSNLRELSNDLTKSATPEVEGVWTKGFHKAADDFDQEYNESGKQKNSFVALGNIITGYFKSLYHGIVAPSGEGAVNAINTGKDYIIKTSVMVGGESLSLVGRTVEVVGLSFFYTGKTGYKIISPTVESGLLISLASVQKISSPIVKAGGETLGLFNQVAVEVVQPTAASASDVANASFQNAKYGGLVTYDLLTTTGSVAISEAKVGVVLGYNALTALPTQLVLGAANTVFFLAWDGPRLVIAKAKGELDSNAVPVGTVVNLEKLKKDPQTKVDVIDEDPKDIEKVLKGLPNDL